MPCKRNWLGTCTCIILLSLTVLSLSCLAHSLFHNATTASFKDAAIIQSVLLPLLCVLCHIPVQCFYLRALWQATFADHLSRLAILIVLASTMVGGMIIAYPQHGIYRHAIIGSLLVILLSVAVIVVDKERVWHAGHLFRPFTFHKDTAVPPTRALQSQEQQIVGK